MLEVYLFAAQSEIKMQKYENYYAKVIVFRLLHKSAHEVITSIRDFSVKLHLRDGWTDEASVRPFVRLSLCLLCLSRVSIL